MITQFDAYVVKQQTGHSAFTSEERAREIAANSYPPNMKVELVEVTSMSGQLHSAWVMKSRK